MRMKIKKKTGDEGPHGLYKGSFHIYLKISDPELNNPKQTLTPSLLTYKALDDTIGDFPIEGAKAVDSDHAPSKK
jgi:hypothetical protein